MGVPRPGFMEPRQKHLRGEKKWSSVMLVSLLMISLIPAIANPVSAEDEGRAISVSMSINPSAQTVNPGETAEYTIIIQNSGSDPVTVQLAANNDAECNGYSSAIGQIAGAIDSGSSEETWLNVTLSQTAEDSCVTTVTATITEQVTPPTQPEQKEATATTTAGDGSGSTLFGVDLILDGPSNKNWNGESTLVWDVEVENTGRVQETVDLTVNTRSGAGCNQDGTFTIDVDPSQVTIDNGSSEWVTVTLEVPDGKSAKKYCWEVTGVVTNDQNPNGSAEDTEDISLTIPELKKCNVELSKTSMSIKPDETGTLVATFLNEGNTAWSVNVGFNGTPSGWSASVDGSSSGNLAIDGEREFTIDITPTDSIEANTQRSFFIEGKDGNMWKCRSSISVTVGQSRGATMSLGNTALYDVIPGQSETTTLSVTNQGNGQDTFRVSSTSPPTGWSVSFESTTITTGSKHSNEKTGTIEVTISLPSDALATAEGEVLTFSVFPTSGGGAYDTAELTITVRAVHGMTASASADEQVGSSQSEVEFPITVNNEGNTLDSFRFSVISQTGSPAWSQYFKTEDNQVMSDLEINARESAIVYLVVTIPECESEDPLDCEYENTVMTVRVTNLGDNNNGDQNSDGIPDNQVEFKFKSILSNRKFSMDALIMISDDELSRNTNFILPPSGEETFMIKIINTGDSTDQAVFEFNGLNGIATRSVSFRGMPINGPITIHKGWGAYNETTSSFYFDGNSPMIQNTEDKIFEKIVEKGLVNSHVPMEYFAVVELTVVVSSGAENGDGGLLEIIVTSESNSADRTGRMTFSLSVESVMEVNLNMDGAIERDVTFGKIGNSPIFEIELFNSGNVESEIKVFHSGGMRGWNIILGYESFADCKNNGDHLICTLDEGESVIVTAKVTPPGGENAEVEDSFTFTLSAEPTEIGLVGRQNLELTVNGQPESFALNSLITTNVLYGMSVLIVLGLIAILLKRRN